MIECRMRSRVLMIAGHFADHFRQAGIGGKCFTGGILGSRPTVQGLGDEKSEWKRVGTQVMVSERYFILPMPLLGRRYLGRRYYSQGGPKSHGLPSQLLGPEFLTPPDRSRLRWVAPPKRPGRRSRKVERFGGGSYRHGWRPYHLKISVLPLPNVAPVPLRFLSRRGCRNDLAS